MASIKSQRYNEPVIITGNQSTSGVKTWKFSLTYKYIGADSYWHTETELSECFGTYNFASGEVLKRARTIGATQIELIGQ